MIRRRLKLLSAVLAVFALGVIAPLPGCQPAHEQPQTQGPFKVAVQGGVMVPMRDGVKLATDLYLPADAAGKAAAGRWPAIMMRTPYDKAQKKADGQFFASHGYVFVAQDTRGRYGSQGIWHMLTDDGPDGADACAWIAKQPWSDGKVGMAGVSYIGGTQHAAALADPPALKTVVPTDAMSDMGYAGMRNGGAFELRFWNWVFDIAAPKGSRAAKDPATAAQLNDRRVHRRVSRLRVALRVGPPPLKLAPEYEDWLVAAMGHGADDEFWSQNDVRRHAGHYKDMPVYLVGGWYDSWAACTSENYKALHAALHGPVYLIMGPWTHGGQGGHGHGQVEFGPSAAVPNVRQWLLTWYDHWLKHIDNAVGKAEPFASPVRIFVMGTGDGHQTRDGKLYHGGYWRDEPAWPLERAKATEFYLRPGGGLSQQKPAGKPREPAEKASTSFRFDPANPVPSIGGNTSSGQGILLMGAFDQRGGKHIWNYQQPTPLSERKDVLVFQTAPLAEDMEVTGEIEVRLWISSSAVDTDFTAKLLDVYPPGKDFPQGFDLNIGDGIIRTRFRDSPQKEVLMQPGTTYPVTIHLTPTSNVFKRGHRIRVDVSSSNFPRFDVNPNTGEPLNDNRRTAVATNTVYHDAEHPSHILLPVVTTTAAEAQRTQRLSK